MKKVLDAIQRRYQTNESACKALLASPAEFSQANALVENEILSHYQFVTAPELDSWLQQHSQKMLSQFNTQPGQQTVRVAAISEPNAFATGQNVTFNAGLVDWYLAPDNVLAQLGYSQEQIREFLGQNASLNPGENGIIGSWPMKPRITYLDIPMPVPSPWHAMTSSVQVIERDTVTRK